MAVCHYNHTRLVGIKTSIPEGFIDVDAELQYFGGSEKKLARQKRMIGYGRRYVADPATTVCDLACDAAEKLIHEMHIDKKEIGLLIVVNQKPDFKEPCDACIAHGVLALSHECTTLDINLGCSGWPHALMVAHALMESGAYNYGLVLAGDIPGRDCDQSNRKIAQVFGDAASAALLKYTDEVVLSTFVTGSDGSGWDKLITPFGGKRYPITEDALNYKSEPDAQGNRWNGLDPLMKGTEVFNFTMDVAPRLVRETMTAAGWKAEDIGLFAIHQANKQIIEMIATKAEIPIEKTPSETFTKYANNSTTSVVTVLCDQLTQENHSKVVVCAFGIGLSWAGAALDMSEVYNGGVTTYIEKKSVVSTREALAKWTESFLNND